MPSTANRLRRALNWRDVQLAGDQVGKVVDLRQLLSAVQDRVDLAPCAVLRGSGDLQADVALARLINVQPRKPDCRRRPRR